MVLGHNRELLVATEFFLVLCRDKNNDVATWFQIISHKNCRNMDFFCCDRGFSSLS